MITKCDQDCTEVEFAPDDRPTQRVRRVEFYLTDQGPEMTVTTTAGNVYTMPVDKLAGVMLHYGTKL